MDTMERHVQAMLDLQKSGAVTFTYGNGIRGQVADRRGFEAAHDLPGFVPEYVRPLFCEGRGPFRWIALSGDPEDIYRTDEVVTELEDSSYRGTAGTIEYYGPDHEYAHDVKYGQDTVWPLFQQWQDGSQEVIYPENLATADYASPPWI